MTQMMSLVTMSNLITQKKISRLEKIPENHLTSSIMMSNLIPQKLISNLKKSNLSL
jgi:hypothetical protein